MAVASGWFLLPAIAEGVGSRVEIPVQAFDAGGWELDAQFAETLGSPCLLAHGLGRPCGEARATVRLPAAGEWRIFVRTRNWLAGLVHAGSPGADPWPCGFRVKVAGVRLQPVFGTAGGDWSWEAGGLLNLPTNVVEVALEDLKGFDARCAGIVFARPDDTRPVTGAVIETASCPTDDVEADFAVIGGGLAGCSAALAAARRGVRTVLVQDRPVLGGNASGEIRVWSGGEIRHPIVRELRGKFPIRDARLVKSDEERLRILRAEPNLRLFLSTRAHGVTLANPQEIAAVEAVELVTRRRLRIHARYYCDATGDGWLGVAAGAGWSWDERALGASIMWTSSEANDDQQFAAPWAEPHACGLCALQGEWYWEYGIGMDSVSEAERIRDRLLLAIYGAFSRAKRERNNSRRVLDFCPYLLGKRESRRLDGDYALTEEDVIRRRPFEDAVATGSWALDAHVPGREGFPGVDFFSTSLEPRHFGRYWIPWRTLYSRRIGNLLMAGRCFSATHEALCSARVVNTCAQMGVAVGTGVSLCLQRNCRPRELLMRERMLEFQRILGGDWPGNPDPSRKGWQYVDDEDFESVAFEGEWRLWYTPSGGQFGNMSHFPGENPGDVTYILPVTEPGVYRLFGIVPYQAQLEHPSVTAYELHSDGQVVLFEREIAIRTGEWSELGCFHMSPGAKLKIIPSRSTGTLIADGFAVLKN